MDIVQEMLTRMLNDDPDLLKKVITDSESWVYGYDIESMESVFLRFRR